jgi:hypothetical protein
MPAVRRRGLDGPIRSAGRRRGRAHSSRSIRHRLPHCHRHSLRHPRCHCLRRRPATAAASASVTAAASAIPAVIASAGPIGPADPPPRPTLAFPGRLVAASNQPDMPKTIRRHIGPPRHAQGDRSPLRPGPKPEPPGVSRLQIRWSASAVRASRPGCGTGDDCPGPRGAHGEHDRARLQISCVVRGIDCGHRACECCRASAFLRLTRPPPAVLGRCHAL